jgi:PKD repeat protein
LKILSNLPKITFFFVAVLLVQNVSSQVVANFTTEDTVGYAPFTVNFINQSTGDINIYLWAFGDGGTSSSLNPSYTYTRPGIYTVQLSVTNGLFNDEIIKRNYITVNINPFPPIITSFAPTSDSAGETVTIYGQHLTSTTAVSFGAYRAISFSVLSDTVITAVIGDGATGAIYVTKASGVDSLSGFTYLGEPLKQQLCPPFGSATLVATLAGTNYQWQQSTDSVHFNNISNNANFNGVNSDTLQLSNIPSSSYGYQYRCIVDGNNSNVYTLQFTDTWTGAVDSVWSNPSNWSCGTVPDNNTDVIINGGTVVLNISATVRSLTVSSNASFTIKAPYVLTVTH